MRAPLNHDLFIREASPGLGGVLVAGYLPVWWPNKLRSSEAPAWPHLDLEPFSCNLDIFISALIETGRQRV